MFLLQIMISRLSKTPLRGSLLLILLRGLLMDDQHFIIFLAMNGHGWLWLHHPSCCTVTDFIISILKMASSTEAEQLSVQNKIILDYMIPRRGKDSRLFQKIRKVLESYGNC